MNSAVARRWGFIMEMLGLGDVEKLRKLTVLAPDFLHSTPHFHTQENTAAGGGYWSTWTSRDES